jgi:hypothetical protein
MAIDSSYYYLVQNLFLPGMALATNGTDIVLTPKATTLSQLGTQMWAFRATIDVGWYSITNLARGAGLFLALDGSELPDHPEHAPKIWSARQVWNVIPPFASSANLVTIASDPGAVERPALPSNWLIFALAGGYQASVFQGNGFTFFKYWQLTRTAVRV